MKKIGIRRGAGRNALVTHGLLEGQVIVPYAQRGGCGGLEVSSIDDGSKYEKMGREVRWVGIGKTRLACVSGGHALKVPGVLW